MKPGRSQLPEMLMAIVLVMLVTLAVLMRQECTPRTVPATGVVTGN